MNLTLKEHLLYANISMNEACKLFGRSERTLMSWNKKPPSWVIRFINIYIQQNQLPSEWANWSFEHEWIID